MYVPNITFAILPPTIYINGNYNISSNNMTGLLIVAYMGKINKSCTEINQEFIQNLHV